MRVLSVTLIWSLVFIIGFNAIGQVSVPPHIKNFLDFFEQKVNIHDYTALLDYIDNKYKKEQLYKNLQGNDKQFVNELLGGYVNLKKEGDFVSCELSDITNVELYSFTKLKCGEYIVTYVVTLSSGVVFYAELLLKVKSKRKMGFIGAYG